MYYNVGFANNRITGKKFRKPDGAYQRLLRDINNIFGHERGIQILLISEFGNMSNSVDIDLNEEAWKSWRWRPP